MPTCANLLVRTPQAASHDVQCQDGDGEEKRMAAMVFQ